MSYKPKQKQQGLPAVVAIEDDAPGLPALDETGCEARDSLDCDAKSNFEKAYGTSISEYNFQQTSIDRDTTSKFSDQAT